MLLALRSLWEESGVVTEEELDNGRVTGRKWPRAMRPRYVHWDDNAALPPLIEIERRLLAKQIAEDDELIALFSSML